MECPRSGKWFGCQFEARYDLGAPVKIAEYNGSAGAIAIIIEATKPKTYVHDICIRCGKVVTREALLSGPSGS